MRTPIQTLVNRIRYKGGRKYRSAYRKLGDYRLSEIFAAGCEVSLVFPNGNKYGRDFQE